MKLWQLVLIALKAALLVSGVARGEVVKLTVDCQGGEIYHGSAVTLGSLKDGRAAVLTAAHVTKGKDARYYIDWREGKQLAGELIAAQQEPGVRDVAIVAVAIPGKWTSLPIADLTGGEQLPVVASGFQYGQKLVKREFLLWNTPGDGLAGSQECRVVDGDSGGPIVSAKHGLVGVIHGFDTGDGTTVYTPAKQVRKFLDEHEIKINFSRVQETQCRNGRCYTQPYGGYVIQSPALIVRPRSVEIAVPPPVIQDPRVTYPGGIRKPVVPPPPREEPIAQQPPCQCKPSRGCNCSTPMVGANGAQGPVGPRGPKGEPGERCECRSVDGDISALKAEIKRLKELPLRVIVRENGTFVGEETYFPWTDDPKKQDRVPVVLDLVPEEVKPETTSPVNVTGRPAE